MKLFHAPEHKIDNALVARNVLQILMLLFRVLGIEIAFAQIALNVLLT
jgi:hypothetical protein